MPSKVTLVELPRGPGATLNQHPVESVAGANRLPGPLANSDGNLVGGGASLILPSESPVLIWGYRINRAVCF